MYKSGNKEEINNYRLISVPTGFSKVIEKAIYTRLINYPENNGLLTNSQHGFRANKSRDTAILQFVNDIYNELEVKILL